MHPQTEQESIFMTFLLGGLDLEVYLVVLDRLLRAMTKKRPSTFSRKKSAPKTKSWLRLWLFSSFSVQRSDKNDPVCFASFLMIDRYSIALRSIIGSMDQYFLHA